MWPKSVSVQPAKRQTWESKERLKSDVYSYREVGLFEGKANLLLVRKLPAGNGTVSRPPIGLPDISV